MKKIILDTDTGSDDAVAIVMALRDPGVQVLACTTVSGNVEVERATYNCLQAIDCAGTYRPPVYEGAGRPLQGGCESTDQVRGQDGMGDLGTLRRPTGSPAPGSAVDAILRLLREGAGDIELVAIGPLTNLALAILQEPETVKKAPHITIMGGAHPYHNPHTVWAEFNIMCDPEAAQVVFSSGIPFTLVTLEACWGDMRFDEDDIARFRARSEAGAFCVDCNRTAIDLARKRQGEGRFPLPGAAAMAALLRPELIKTSFPSYTQVDCKGRFTRGATLFEPIERRFVTDAFGLEKHRPNSTVVTEMDGAGFKEYLMGLL
ncbi:MULTISPECIES: nucleoside hydrolase [Eubacteriales]|uniref:Nucleoside hydrolase n=1 Tax=Bittarella massiliensis (ex Durand et al. 2017) TaxID=1720313 RepID=A0AAQ1MFQ4_9FIRM|nr:MULTISPECIES: nucleoside hydrolase [Eubacteriales]ERI96217.1 putative cytidine/uridine-specific hydrolase [Clostridium sp. ATCC 29733]MZL69275.1 nucleoside hydrolase [Bittarella massiliensis (ex Durand et al. 2017)]MZL79183.1 nucleoside hydrolase [Bittarella massiliensis (ex Durand et al. 2017)]SHG55788.1 purine nucleosidase [Bittarella massiliensis (ex Durand et al. 2017)]